ncbi:hypothetical protein ACFLXQ_04735 [Chloroflexota bacterium]
MKHITVTETDDKTGKQVKTDYHLSNPNSRAILRELLDKAEQQYGPALESQWIILASFFTAAACKCFELLKKLAKDFKDW